MAYLLCAGREGSYGTNMCNLYIEEGCLTNTTEYTTWSGGEWKGFIKPVGVYYYSQDNNAYYFEVYGSNGTQQGLAKSENGGETMYYAYERAYFDFGAYKEMVYQDLIPFFNNQTDASAYSRGAFFNVANWVGGKVVTPTYTWEIIEELIVSGNKYTWNFPTALKQAILNQINTSVYAANVVLLTGSTLSDYNITTFPFVNHTGSDGSWTGTGNSYTIGNATMTIGDANAGYAIALTDGQYAGSSGIDNTNGTIIPTFVINKTEQKAAIISIRSSWYLSGDKNKIKYWGYGTSSTEYNQVYQDIFGALPVLANWHSLQSLTGNGQTVQLVTLNLNAINDGEPVSNADISSFSILPSNANNVRYLVNLAVAAAASESTNDVTVSYTIPALKKGTYTTVKLYGKIGEYPACDNTDDLIEDLDPTKITKDILGLTGNSTYYFCIQFITSDGLKLSSNVESIFIDEIPIPEDIRPYLDIINGTGFFWKNYSDEYDLGGGYKQKADVYPYENYTYCAIPSDANNKINVASIIVDSNDAVCIAGNIYSIYITSNQDVYSVDISFIKLESVAHNMWNGATWNGIYFYSSTDRFDGRGFSYISSLPVTGSFSGTLAGIGAWIAARFRNANIYLNGNLISKANNV